MSRTRKRKDPYAGTKVKMRCPRKGYCFWCDSNRQHQALSAQEAADKDLHDYQVELAWDD